MAEREMSGKVLLNKLYNGLDTMPAADAARDFRRLNDDFLGKPADLTASGQHAADSSVGAAKARSGSRSKIVLSSLAILCVVAVGGVIAAGALRESDKQAAALAPPPPAATNIPMPAPLEQPAEVAPPPEPVVLVNPFDRTEKFTFPPGTSKADAREQMAAMLLQRAVERGADRPRARKLAAEPRKPSNAHGS